MTKDKFATRAKNLYEKKKYLKNPPSYMKELEEFLELNEIVSKYKNMRNEGGQ